MPSEEYNSWRKGLKEIQSSLTVWRDMLNGHPMNQLKGKHGTYHTIVLNMQAVKSELPLIVGQKLWWKVFEQ